MVLRSQVDQTRPNRRACTAAQSDVGLTRRVAQPVGVMRWSVVQISSLGMSERMLARSVVPQR